MDDLIEADAKATEIVTLTTELAALLPVTDRDTQQRLARMERDAKAIREAVCQTAAAAA